MGLPIERIMSEVEEEMLQMNEEENEELLNGELAEVEHMVGELDEDEVDLEVDEDLEKDLDGISIEVVEGNKPGSRWLIVDSVHICHKQKVFLTHVAWRCEDFREYRCPFKIVTTKEESENGMKIESMTKKVLHSCSKDKVRPILHKFKLKLSIRMRADLDITWRKIWDEERQILKDGLKDSPLLLDQVLLELKDSRSFRVAAQRARAKETPKIPKNHDEMDPEKVNSFFVTKENRAKTQVAFITLVVFSTTI